MEAIDWVGIILFVGVVLYGIYKIWNQKGASKGCGCGGSGKCSKPKVYDSKNKES